MSSGGFFDTVFNSTIGRVAAGFATGGLSEVARGAVSLVKSATSSPDTPALPTPPQIQQQHTNQDVSQAKGSAATQLTGDDGADTTLAPTFSAGRTLLGK